MKRQLVDFLLPSRSTRMQNVSKIVSKTSKSKFVRTVVGKQVLTHILRYVLKSKIQKTMKIFFPFFDLNYLSTFFTWKLRDNSKTLNKYSMNCSSNVLA